MIRPSTPDENGGKLERRGQPVDKSKHAARLLKWYDVSKRDLPWRAKSGTKPDPYGVWLSEIMLQQTVVKTVIPYYTRFLKKWPDVGSLCAAELDEVLTLWAGLGYYSRARNLHACARTVVAEFEGLFPDNQKDLMTLPGIGPYTAAAITAIAFGKRACVVDGNVERVIARLFALKSPLPGVKPELKEKADDLTPTKRPGDYAQAMMDLGATVCAPKTPSCLSCPLAFQCLGYKQGVAQTLPVRAKKSAKPMRRGVAFVALRQDGSVLLRKRPLRGLLAGMMEVPGSPWVEQQVAPVSIDSNQPIEANWQPTGTTISHTFTHFHLQVLVMKADVGRRAIIRKAAQPEACTWVRFEDLKHQALPSVMRKILAAALPVIS